MDEALKSIQNYQQPKKSRVIIGIPPRSLEHAALWEERGHFHTWKLLISANVSNVSSGFSSVLCPNNDFMRLSQETDPPLDGVLWSINSVEIQKQKVSKLFSALPYFWDPLNISTSTR